MIRAFMHIDVIIATGHDNFVVAMTVMMVVMMRRPLEDTRK